MKLCLIIQNAAVHYVYFAVVCEVEQKPRTSIEAVVGNEGTTHCLREDNKQRAEPGVHRLPIIAIGQGVSLAPLASVLSDVRAPAVHLPTASFGQFLGTVKGVCLGVRGINTDLRGSGVCGNVGTCVVMTEPL